jgi:hypothetical protein
MIKKPKLIQAFTKLDKLKVLTRRCFLKWLKAELNCRPWAYESPALTTELLSQNLTILIMP